MRAMTQGYVTPGWAWRHHRKWLRQLVATGSIGPRPRMQGSESHGEEALVRQGGAPPTGKWVGSPLGGVKTPEALILPTRRSGSPSVQLGWRLWPAHPMSEWLHFISELSRAQHVATAALGPSAPLEQAVIERVVAARMPPLAADWHRRESANWRDGLAVLLDIVR